MQKKVLQAVGAGVGWGAAGRQEPWELILDLPGFCVLLWDKGSKVSTLGQWEMALSQLLSVILFMYFQQCQGSRCS